MANNLDREIEKNEVVVIAKKWHNPQFQSLEHRLFRATDGFGMSSFTMGNAIYGDYLLDGDKSRIEGFMIDKKETLKFQEEFGKFGEKYPKKESS